MPIQIVPFQKEHLAAAADLLAQRHRRERRSISELPDRFEDSTVAARAIRAALARDRAHGYVALDNGRLVAYLIGDMVIDSVWGRSGWVRLPGCAYDPNADIEAVRDLYTALGGSWVDQGVFSHVALIPSSDPNLTQAWFSLAFGIEQVHALLDLTAIDPEVPTAPGAIDIRQAGPDDRHHLAAMSDVIWRTQIEAPVWGAMMPEEVSEVEDGWAGLVDDEDVIAWLAMRDEQPVGVQIYWPAEATDGNMLIAEKCIHLGVAGTRPSARCQGIGVALTAHGLAQAAAAGYRFCETDWRSTNLLSSRFWPRRGFRPAVYRLARRVDTRIAWANGMD
jgi:GNAT superfamily N-acetyltransferase